MVSGCLSGFLDCDREFENGCEAELGTEATCGGCGDVCTWKCDATGCDDVVGVSTGGFHSCALRESGRVFCWGANDYSQLGLSSPGGRLFATTAVAMIGDAVQIASGERHSCARSASGAVRCWGWGSSGQLGNGGVSTSATPLAVAVPAATTIALGRTHSCAIDSAGRLYCWGRNGEGELGDGTQTQRDTPRRISAAGTVSSVGTGDSHTCVVSGGTVRCWGANGQGQLGGGGASVRELSPIVISGLNGVTEVRAGRDHSCALRGDGTVWCWGGNDVGQLGDGTFSQRTSPVRVDLSSVRSISAASDARHTCAIRTDDSLWCWGLNTNGQVGDRTLDNRNTPVRIAEEIAAVAVGWTHTCASTIDGRPVCWGANGSGRLGDGTSERRSSPTPVLPPTD
ncbi:MAG: chromosome condensation regulator RCC1 [Sandaracinus sp.]|nr:chromosome condensation regulator RCC1 [Sandaracinus sp.]